ncbi:MAG: sialate O-acetylesterase, partial [Oscillospiraceae bacterium]|nr:sialate O-acetylesterase [Oscillospiraceae bacterium]
MIMLMDFRGEQFDVILQAGQSNCEGGGLGPIDRPFEPDDSIWYLNGDFTVTKAAEAVWGNEIVCNLSLPFSARYIQKGLLQPPRKLLIIRAAVGGTGFLDMRWGLKDDLYLRMMKMTETALSLNAANRLAAFIWHQGESDASNNAAYETHYWNLTALLKSVRETFDCKRLPFIAGDFVQDWKGSNREICEPVVQAIRAVCQDAPPAALVETAGVILNPQGGDHHITIHFPDEETRRAGVGDS